MKWIIRGLICNDYFLPIGHIFLSFPHVNHSNPLSLFLTPLCLSFFVASHSKSCYPTYPLYLPLSLYVLSPIPSPDIPPTHQVSLFLSPLCLPFFLASHFISCYPTYSPYLSLSLSLFLLSVSFYLASHSNSCYPTYSPSLSVFLSLLVPPEPAPS